MPAPHRLRGLPEHRRTSTQWRRRRRPLVALFVATAVLCGGGILALAGSASAATLLSDTFEDGDTAGWSKSGGTWSVVTDGSKVLSQTKVSTEPSRFFAGSTSWTDYSVQARVKPLSFSSATGVVALAARSTSSTSAVRLALLGSGKAQLQSVSSGAVTILGTSSAAFTAGSWHTLKLELAGGSVRALVDGAVVATGSTPLTAGRVGLLTAGGTASFDDVTVVSGGSVPSPTTPPAPTTAPTTGPPTATPPASTGGPTPPTAATGLVGWATQNGGTTGGAGRPSVTVTTAADLTAAAKAGNATIVVKGTIALADMTRVGSNTTITSDGTGTITGSGLNVRLATNVIVSNIAFSNWSDDAISVEESTNVWVDHNSFTNGYDGTVDVKAGSDFVTISWNRTFAHAKTMLLGHSDNNGAQDRGHLRVSYHHNFFDGSGTRHPRVRFGNPVHVFNNYYSGNEYGVASTETAGVLVEGNYFENVTEPTHVGYAGSVPGTLVARDNVLVNSGPVEAAGSVGAIPYRYTLDPAASVKSIVTAGAGPGRGTTSPPTTVPSPTTGPAPTATPKPTTGPVTPTPKPTTPPTSPPTTPPGGASPTAPWPTPSGSVEVNATIAVSGSLDGGMKRYYGIGDGGQSESQDPMFELANGASLSNVVIGAPAGDGVHCLGTCTLTNVWWEDVGEDAATFLGTAASQVMTVNGGGARGASDKVFQHNGPGTFVIRNFQVSGFGKLYRSCGNCSVSHKRDVVIDNVVATMPGKSLVGINTNFGDVAKISRLVVVGDSSRKLVACEKYQGAKKGSEPTKIGSGPDGTHCLYRDSDVTYR